MFPAVLLHSCSYGHNIRSGASTDMSPNAFNTDFENLDFFLPIQVTFGRHQHIVASGIFGNILFIVWCVTFFLLIRFLIILVPLERGGLCGHFKSDPSQIHRRNSEKQLPEVGEVKKSYFPRILHRVSIGNSNGNPM